MQCGNCGSENLKDASFCSNCGASLAYKGESQSFNDQSRGGISPQATNKPTKIYRSRGDRVIAGVCGGIGKYLDVDPNVIRILFVILTLMGGSGIFLYIILVAILPESPMDPWREN